MVLKSGGGEMAKLTHERLIELLSYDPMTGWFVWLKPTSPRVSVGSRAGVVAANGRRYISLDSEKFMAHRLAWFFLHGEWPEGDVKQKNDDFDDCRADNLEDVSRSVASRARSLDNRNKSGYRGVSQDKRGHWQAFITRNYKQVFLGNFDTPEDASTAYEAAALEMDPAISLDEKKAAAEASKIRRRLRVAWKRLNEMEPDHFFADYDEFVATVKDVPPRHSVVAVADTGPIAPGNWDVVPDLSTGFDLSTREGRIAYGRAHRKANPEIYRDRQLRKDFGISSAEFDAALALQGGVCAICERPERAMRDGEPIHLAQDHDHATGKNRGILCGACNKAIGKFEDNPDFLRNAIVYLAKHGTAAPFVCDAINGDYMHATLGFGT